MSNIDNTQDQARITFIHLRQRHNSIASEKGGYTVAVRERDNGLFSVSICQCNTNQRYDDKLGEKIAAQRINRGQFFVQNKDELVATLNTLHSKLCTGTVPRLALDGLPFDTEKLAA
jgi:hypothetical protein